jgi:hypothetical protein
MNGQASWTFQRETLARLKQQAISELRGLPPRKQIEAPAAAKGWSFFVCREDTLAGGLRITVEARRRTMLFFESVSSPSFELTSDGSVVEQEADPED